MQVVDHSGSAEDGADLIYAQLEKIIKQVKKLQLAQPFHQITITCVPLSCP